MTEARDVVVTVREVEKLFCPYTGKHVEVHMLVKPGSITFCAPKAFTLAEPVGSVEELLRRASMRDGVSGVVNGPDARVDVYTGEELRLSTAVSTASGVRPPAIAARAAATDCSARSTASACRALVRISPAAAEVSGG